MMSIWEAQAWVDRLLTARRTETVRRANAVGRTLAADVRSALQPAKATALVAGLAVRAAETEGASDYAPVPVAGTAVQAGEAMPAAADSVLEDGWDGLAIAAVAPGHGVAPAGHDVPDGAVLAAGTVLTALHLAVMGDDPLVRARLRVAAEGIVLPSLIGQAGGAWVETGADLILTRVPLSAVKHAGIAMRPGETTVLGHLGSTPAIHLPQHPAAQATVFLLLVAPVLRRAAGRPEPVPAPATLTRKIVSGLGVLDAVRVRVVDGAATPLGPADGIGLLAAAAADGLVLVPEGSEGYPAGAMVTILPL